MLNFLFKTFSELTTKELYAILQIRCEVFVVEQDCVYQDIDGKDEKALHILGYKNNELIAYSRLFNKGNYFDNASIGRVLVKKTERKYGYGHDLLKFSIQTIKDEFSTSKIEISAQLYLEKFYKLHGFKTIGTTYLEDGIPHIKMIRT